MYFICILQLYSNNYICCTICIHAQDTEGFFCFFVFSVKIIRAHFSSLNGNYSIPLKQVDSYIILDSNFFFVCLFLSLDIWIQ